MFDFDNLRNEQLIEEREAYENMFFSMEDIKKSDELNSTIFQHEFQINFVDEFELSYEIDYEFLLEEDAIRLRDESLIENRLFSEIDYFTCIKDEIIEKDTLDLIIESYDENFFEYPDYEILDYDYFDYCDDLYEYQFPEYDMDAAYCGHELFGYLVSDDPFDSLGGCDYPEGPDENIEGFRYPDEFFMDLSFNSDYPEPEILFEEQYSDLTTNFEPQVLEDFWDYQSEITFKDNEDKHMQKLIEEHIEEENLLLKSEIRDEYFLPSADEDIIFY